MELLLLLLLSRIDLPRDLREARHTRLHCQKKVRAGQLPRRGRWAAGRGAVHAARLPFAGQGVVLYR